MRTIDCQQGSQEWLRARLGVPTASEFHRIITHGGKESSAAKGYMAQLAAEWFMDEVLEDYTSPFMQRGTELESSAVSEYEFTNDVTVEKVGLCLLDDIDAGASPDRLVGEDGALEIKCVKPATHMLYVLDGVPNDYTIQVQGQLWVTGRKYVDLLCWHPTLPRVTKRFERDEPFITALDKAVRAFVSRLDAFKEVHAEARAEQLAEKAKREQESLDDIPAELTP